MSVFSRRVLPLACLGWIVALSACETSVAPRTGADRHFSMYGVVNPEADSQGVIVFPIENELRVLPAEPLDAIVTSTDLETGGRFVWSDSMVFRENGVVHVYWAPFRASHGRTYRINVASASGERHSEVTVTVPPRAEIVPGGVFEDIWVRQNVAVTAPVDRLNFLLVRYVIKAKLPPASLAYPVLLPDKLPDFGAPPPTDPTAPPVQDSLIVQRLFVPIAYSDKAQLNAEGWTIPLNFSDDFREIRQRVSRRGTRDAAYGIRLEAIEISLVAANAEWTAPGDQYEASILIQPGAMSNVQGGFGFVGAGYRLEHRYQLPDDVLTRIGFRLDNDQAAQ